MEEIEILLAERKAFWIDSPGQFEDRLLKAGPLTLYWTLNQSLLDKFSQPTFNQVPIYKRLTRHIRSEMHRLKEKGAVAPHRISLEELL